MKKLVFIISAAHSGSTLADMIIGAHTEAFSLGEIVNLPKAANSKTEPCVCGIPVSKCKFWKPIINKLDNKYDIQNLPNNVSINLNKQQKYDLILPIRNIKIFEDISKKRNFKLMKDLYDLVYSRSQRSLLVDSSKDWIRPIYFNKLLHNKRIYVLHLVRDGRGVLNSGLKTKYKINPEDNKSYHRIPQKENTIIKSWIKTNMISSIFLKAVFRNRYMQIKYEDICNNSEITLMNLTKFLGIEYQSKMLDFGKEEHHNIGGNPMRHDKKLSIRKIDDKWKRNLSKTQLINFRRKAGWLNRLYGYK